MSPAKEQPISALTKRLSKIALKLGVVYAHNQKLYSSETTLTELLNFRV